jgi:hypothetical protein
LAGIVITGFNLFGDKIDQDALRTQKGRTFAKLIGDLSC